MCMHVMNCILDVQYKCFCYLQSIYGVLVTYTVGSFVVA